MLAQPEKKDKPESGNPKPLPERYTTLRNNNFQIMTMKKYHFLLYLFCGLMVLSLSSCWDDDDDDEMTDEEISTAMSNMRGTYSGSLLVIDHNSTVVLDTIENITAKIDSVFTITNFPASSLAVGFETGADSNLVKSVEALGTMEVKCAIGFYSQSDENYYTMVMQPSVLYFNATVGTTQKQCAVVFSWPNEYSLGVYSISAGGLSVGLNVYGLSTDLSSYSSYYSGPKYIFNGTKD